MANSTFKDMDNPSKQIDFPDFTFDPDLVLPCHPVDHLEQSLVIRVKTSKDGVHVLMSSETLCPFLGFWSCFFTSPSFVYSFFPSSLSCSLFEPADPGKFIIKSQSSLSWSVYFSYFFLILFSPRLLDAHLQHFCLCSEGLQGI